MLIRTERLTKSFSKFIAVNDLTIGVPEGQVTAIIGPNGAGKTTLINLLTGVLTPDQGKIFFHDDDITTLSTNARVRRGIGRSFQITYIFPDLTVRDNVAIAALAHAGQTFSMIRSVKSFNGAYNHVDKILEQIGLEESSDIPAGELSHGDQRRLEISIALATEPRLLILDEPTAGMNPRERKQILELLGTLVRSGGITLLLVEHDMDIVFTLADHIIVLNHGSLLSKGIPQEIRNDPKVEEVYLGAVLRETTLDREIREEPAKEEILKVDGIDTYYGMSHILRNVSLEVGRGETVALLGRNGVGKTTTLRSIMGITPPKRGSIRFRGEDITGFPPYRVCSRGVGYTPDDRRIFPNLTTLQNLMLPTQVQKKRNRVWTVEKVEEIFPPLKDLRHRRGRFLSGGEQKMLSIGRALMVDPDLLILDEPSEGLSPMIVSLLLEAIVQIRKEGTTTLLADQNLNFAYMVADRAYILDKGTVAHTDSLEALWTDKETVKRYLAV